MSTAQSPQPVHRSTYLQSTVKAVHLLTLRWEGPWGYAGGPSIITRVHRCREGDRRVGAMGCEKDLTVATAGSEVEEGVASRGMRAASRS